MYTRERAREAQVAIGRLMKGLLERAEELNQRGPSPPQNFPRQGV